MLSAIHVYYLLNIHIFFLHSQLTSKIDVSEQSLKYCLIRQLNNDQSSNIIADKALRVSFYSFKVYLKNRIVGTYKELCEISNCHVCNIVKNA